MTLKVLWKNLKFLRKKSLKFGVSYSVYDGVELLEKSIKSIRSSVDYVNVVYSDISWYGEKSDCSILPILEKLKKKELINDIILYTPNLNISAAENELKKRNLGLRYAKKAKVNYFMTMDADEFYLKDEVERAKKIIIENEITHSFCNVVNYFVLPTERFWGTPSYVQFFSKLRKTSVLKKNKKNITLVDPTRQLSHFFGAKYYFLPSIEMHHMTNLRKDLLKKFRNSTARDAYKNISSVRHYIKEYKCKIKSPDLFHLLPLAKKYLKGCLNEEKI